MNRYQSLTGLERRPDKNLKAIFPQAFVQSREMRRASVIERFKTLEEIEFIETAIMSHFLFRSITAEMRREIVDKMKLY
jgi:hypothetical protein